MAEREPWPNEVRSRAMALAVDVDSETAEAATGVPAATIRSWLKRSLDYCRPFLPTDLQTIKSWSEARVLLVDALGPVTLQVLVALSVAVEEDRARDAKDYAITLGVLSDKAALFSGEATKRTDARVLHGDVGTASKDRIAQLRAEVAELKAAAGE